MLSRIKRNLLSLFLSCCFLVGATFPTVAQSSAPFSITMLNVGQGLALVIQSNGHYMLYDGGGRNYSSYVVSYLQKHKIHSLDYIVVSHYDDDHINGLVGALHTCHVKKAILPHYKVSTRVYRSLLSQIQSQKIPVSYPKSGAQYKLGNAKIRVVAPSNYRAQKENNRSIAMTLSYGHFRALVTGDAEQEEEKVIARSKYPLRSNLYIVGHHGSATSSTISLLSHVRPNYAFLSVGKSNSYGHPSKQALQNLQQYRTKLYRTDFQGMVSVFSNGTHYWFSKKPSTNWHYGQSSSSSSSNRKIVPSSSHRNNGKYIVNIQSLKFHNPNCPSVSKISKVNKRYTNNSRQTLIRAGYHPCSRCYS